MVRPERRVLLAGARPVRVGNASCRPEKRVADRKGRKRAGYRPDINGMRAIAVGAVLLFPGFPPLCPGGFVGVDMFFVISSFLITGIIVQGLTGGAFTTRDFTFEGFAASSRLC